MLILLEILMWFTQITGALAIIGAVLMIIDTIVYGAREGEPSPR